MERFRNYDRTYLTGMAAKASRPVVVRIDGQDYKLNDLPPDDSKLVMTEKNKILGVGLEVDIKDLANNICSFESLVRRIGEVVEAAGPSFTESQLTIQHLKPKTTALCTKFALTILKLKEITSTIHVDLVAVYKDLVDCHEETAVEMLIVVLGAAKDMEKVVGELQCEFQAVETVEHALRLTEMAIGQEEAQSSSGRGMDNLHQAVRLFKELSVILRQAGHFWKQVCDHCKSLADEFLKRIIQRAMTNYPEEKRSEVWTSVHFKTRMVQLYAGWVALHSICSAYIKYVTLSQPDFYTRLQGSIAMDGGAVETLEKCLSKLRIHHAQKTGRTENSNLPNIGLALKLLQPVAAEWQNIGCILEISSGELDSIRREERERCSDCLRRMLETWLKQINPPPTWEALVEAVSVYNPKIAEELKKVSLS